MKRHRFDPFSFVFGLIFLLIAGAGVWNQNFRWDLNAWVLPAAALFLGIALLASTLRFGSQDSGVDAADISSGSTPESSEEGLLDGVGEQGKDEEPGTDQDEDAATPAFDSGT